MFKKNKKRIKSKKLLDILTGETVEKANTRVEENCHIDYATYERYKDEDGTETLMKKRG